MSRATPLVIGFGNRLRGDDGVGYLLAERLWSALTPGAAVQVLACQQLTLDLAAVLQSASAVLFVDAALPSEPRQQLRLQALEPSGAGEPWSHVLTPGHLLSLAAVLYNACPPAWELLIPGEHWELSECLSPATAAAAEAALPLLQRWAVDHA